MMPGRARLLVLVTIGSFGAGSFGCARADVATVDPEAQLLDPPVVIVEEPPPEDEDEALAEVDAAQAPATVAKDPETEVITFVGADAPPAMADEITAAPKRDPLPSMMSDVIHGPNK